jgi:hypothetical protein
MVQTSRRLADIIHDIGSIPHAERVLALRAGGVPVRHICYFTYSPMLTIDLPTKDLGKIASISPMAFGDAGIDIGGDLLLDYAARLVRLFAAGVTPGLSSSKRLRLYIELCERATEAEVALLTGIVRHRTIQGIHEADVESAWPGLLALAPRPDGSPPAPPRAPGAAEAEYARAMAGLGWA